MDPAAAMLSTMYGGSLAVKLRILTPGKATQLQMMHVCKHGFVQGVCCLMHSFALEGYRLRDALS
jgi:hypothetical protein